MDREIDRRIGAAAAVMRSMYRSVVVKKELSRKAKLSIYQSIYAPTLTYGHELWVMTKRDVSLERCSGHAPPGRGPGEDPGHAGETMSFGWPGNALGSLRKSWRKWLGRGRQFSLDKIISGFIWILKRIGVRLNSNVYQVVCGPFSVVVLKIHMGLASSLRMSEIIMKRNPTGAGTSLDALGSSQGWPLLTEDMIGYPWTKSYIGDMIAGGLGAGLGDGQGNGLGQG
ncbi:hypothetical protein QTP86_018763 [Hemibagrus guttatus]|nr:hypothetical protein QTP86_018763 [Hemibagrus guttatus]